MRIFDANLILGQLGWRPIGVEHASEMLSTMDRLCIGRGLVAHLTACVHDVDVGNRTLLDEVGGHESRLLPVPVVDLSAGDRWQRDLSKWEKAVVRALRVAPAFYDHRLEGPRAEDLVEVAREHDWPVVITIQAIRGIPWPGCGMSMAVQFAQRFPQVRVLIAGASRNHLNDLFEGLASASNLYAELANMQVGFALEQLVEAGFEDRLLCGTNYGASYAGVCIDRIKWSGIPESAKEKILFNNSKRLLGEG